jgi:hypothetical protein
VLLAPSLALDPGDASWTSCDTSESVTLDWLVESGVFDSPNVAGHCVLMNKKATG